MPITYNTDNIFAYAADCVDNKSVAARLGHSAKLHSLRSALSAPGKSGVTKAGAVVGAVFRATVSAIPIPVVGGLIAAIESNVEGRIRTWHHGKNLKGSTDLAEQVKFEMKEMSVTELDRYRWKVKEAMEKFNKVATGFSADYTAKKAEGATCEALVELAIAAQQVLRRINRLKIAINKLSAAAALAENWLVACEAGAASPPLSPSGNAPSRKTNPAVVEGCLNNVRATILAAVEAELKPGVDAAASGATPEQIQAAADHQRIKHAKCERWCCFRGGKSDEWADCKDRAAKVVRILSDPFGPADFTSGTGDLWS